MIIIYPIQKKIKVSVLLTFLFCTYFVFTQIKTLDSLKHVLRTVKQDTLRCYILNSIIESEADDHVWPAYNLELKKISEQNLSNNLTPAQKKFFKKNLASALNNEGYLAQINGNIVLALQKLQESLKLFEECNSLREIAVELNLIGLLYQKQGESANALNYFQKALKISEGLKDQEQIAASTNNIGMIFDAQDKLALALECYERTLKIHTEMGLKNGVAISLNNIGLIYQRLNKTELALEYFQKCLKIWEELGDSWGVCFSLDMIGRNYLKQKDWKNALNCGKKSFEISKKLGRPEDIRNASDLLSNTYKALNKPAEALDMYLIYIKMRDSINNQETKKASIRSQLKYEFEKKAVSDSIKVMEEKKVTAAQLKAEETQRYALYGGLGLVGLFAVFMVNRFRITNRQKKLIEEQKAVVEKQKILVEEKQKEVMDSIHYAQRIQRALITNENYIDKTLKKLQKK